MCWIGRKDSIVLEKDMPVFKIVTAKGTDIYSFYQSFHYQLNKLYTTELDVRKAYGNIVINRGFHSYATDCPVERITNLHIAVHSMVNYYDYEIYYDRSYPVLKQPCIIPSGSTVYINQVGEIVSNQIILI